MTERQNSEEEQDPTETAQQFPLPREDSKAQSAESTDGAVVSPNDIEKITSSAVEYNPEDSSCLEYSFPTLGVATPTEESKTIVENSSTTPPVADDCDQTENADTPTVEDNSILPEHQRQTSSKMPIVAISRPHRKFRKWSDDPRTFRKVSSYKLKMEKRHSYETKIQNVKKIPLEASKYKGDESIHLATDIKTSSSSNEDNTGQANDKVLGTSPCQEQHQQEVASIINDTR